MYIKLDDHCEMSETIEYNYSVPTSEISFCFNWMILCFILYNVPELDTRVT